MVLQLRTLTWRDHTSSYMNIRDQLMLVEKFTELKETLVGVLLLLLFILCRYVWRYVTPSGYLLVWLSLRSEHLCRTAKSHKNLLCGAHLWNSSKATKNVDQSQEDTSGVMVKSAQKPCGPSDSGSALCRLQAVSSSLILCACTTYTAMIQSWLNIFHLHLYNMWNHSCFQCGHHFC